MDAGRGPGDRDYGFWAELPCMGCGRAFGTPDPAFRICSDCRGEFYETLAHRIDPGYDPSAEHDWRECATVLNRLGLGLS